MLDWQTGEEQWESAASGPDALSESTRDGDTALPFGRRFLKRHIGAKCVAPARWLLVTVGAILVAGGTIAGYLRWEAIQQAARLRQDIQATIDAEQWAHESHNLHLYRSLLDPDADPGWRERQVRAFRAAGDAAPPGINLTDVFLFGADLAVTELNVTLAQRPVRRITRAYHRTGGMWLETSIPAGQVWLDQQSLETDYLRFVFHHSDAARVRAVMPAVQDLYSQLLRDLRLSPPRGKRPLYVILSVDPIVSELDHDPTYYDLSDLGPDAPISAIQRRLGARLLEEVMAVFASEPDELPFIVRSVGEWEYADWLSRYSRAEATLSRTVASHELGTDGMATPFDKLRMPPFDELGPSPLALGAADLMVNLPFLPLTDREWTTLRQPSIRSAVGQALVSYIAETYGRERLADLVRGSRRTESLYPLVTQSLHTPFALKVPFSDFDAGWRTYALEHFTPQSGVFQSTTSSPWAALVQRLGDERWSIDHNRFATYQGLFAPDADPDWLEQQYRLFGTYRNFLRQTNSPMDLRLEDAVVRGQEALVRVEEVFPDPGSTPYEQIRVYRRYDGDWKWAGVLASFWGLTEEADSGPLRWRFNRQDAEVVKAEMAVTEDFFRQVASDLTLINHARRWQPPAATVDVVPGYRVLNGQQGRMQVQIVSPTLGHIATDMTAGDFYRLAAGSALARYLLAMAAGPPPAPTPFADAVHDAVAHWEVERFAPAPWLGPRQAFLAALVASDGEASLRGRPTWTERDVDPAITYLYDSAVAYFADTYGRRRLGDLVREARGHSDWEALIPAVVGMQFAEFEAGWRANLVATYGDE
jgi:hypothetical protein